MQEKKKIILGNWKMNQQLADVANYLNLMKRAMSNNPNIFQQCIWGIAPQALHLAYLLKEKPNELWVGAQNCASVDFGAYTGEISPVSLKDMGVDFVIVGHSERRSIFREQNRDINAKVLRALDLGLKVVLCVGENLREREENMTLEIVDDQMREGLHNVAQYLDEGGELIIAYEPVWAIGTGKTATSEEAQAVHHHLRHQLRRFGLPEKTSILYGGSVKPSNAAELLSMPDIDGALVGGASLKAEEFFSLLPISP